MLFAISGSQGSGKSTTLAKLADVGFDVIQRKTARSILSEYPGKSLEDIYNEPELCKEFHEKILARKIEDEREAARSDDIWFTERSYADLFTYACMSLGRNNKYSKWLDCYYHSCKMMNEMTYNHIFYLEGGKFSVEHDGVRGSNQHYATMIDTALLAFTKKMCIDTRDGYRIIETPDLAERALMISSVASNIWLENTQR